MIVRETSTPEYWNDIYESGMYQPGTSITPFERQMFLSYVGPKHRMVALDAGCGKGEFADFLGALRVDVLGLDFAAAAIRKAQRDVKNHDHVTFGVHDFDSGAIDSRLKPQSLDIIVCRLSLAFMDRHRFLVDARRWLRPTGVLHITTHVIEHTPPFLRHRGLSEAAVDDLGTGWGRCIRYDLETIGNPTCLVLRDPYG